MKAFYDSEADALQIHFTEPPRIGYSEKVDGTACFVEVDDNDEKVGVELLWTTEHLELIDWPRKVRPRCASAEGGRGGGDGRSAT